MSDDPITELVSSVSVGPSFDGFAVFVVGGAVRDALRGVDPDDVDLMAVPRPGEVSDPVGVLEARMTRIDPESAFPVFRDSRGREVALPRTEESTGQGFHDFDVSLVPPGTPVPEAVRTDLHRRDLTVNAMAANARTGELFDPFGGVVDLRDGVVRHVSEAFREDPLRVVRLARFAARLDADVADDTLRVARETAPKVAAVPQERVTQEARKTFKQAPDPARFFRVLERVDALGHAFPTLAALSRPDRRRALAHVREMAAIAGTPRLGFAALGAGLDPEDGEALADRQDLRNEERRVVHEAARLTRVVRRPARASDTALVRAAERLHEDGGLSPMELLAVTQARARALGVAFPARAAAERLRVALRAVDRVGGETVMDRESVHPGRDVSGEQFGEMLRDHRVRFLREQV